MLGIYDGLPTGFTAAFLAFLRSSLSRTASTTFSDINMALMISLKTLNCFSLQLGKKNVQTHYIGPLSHGGSSPHLHFHLICYHSCPRPLCCSLVLTSILCSSNCGISFLPQGICTGCQQCPVTISTQVAFSHSPTLGFSEKPSLMVLCTK